MRWSAAAKGQGTQKEKIALSIPKNDPSPVAGEFSIFHSVLRLLTYDLPWCQQEPVWLSISRA